MSQILVDVLVTVVSVLSFSALNIWTATSQRCSNLWSINFLIAAPLFAAVWEGGYEAPCLLLFSSFLSDLLTHPILRRKVNPPCVGVRVLPQIRPLCVIIWTAMLLPTPLFALFSPEEFFKWITSVPVILAFVSIGGFLILMLCGRSEICANGLWLSGTLVAWNNYESASWTMKDKKAVVELAIAGKEPWESYSYLFLTMPPENVEAAKQLLDANLAIATPEKVRA